MVIVPTSVVVLMAFVTSEPIFKVIVIPSAVCSGPFKVWEKAVVFGAKFMSNFVLSHLRASWTVLTILSPGLRTSREVLV